MTLPSLPLNTRFRLVAQHAAVALCAGSAAALAYIQLSDELSQTDVLAAAVISVAAGALPMAWTKFDAVREKFIFPGAVAGFVLAGTFGYTAANYALSAQEARFAADSAEDGTLLAQKACKKAMRSGQACHAAY